MNKFFQRISPILDIIKLFIISQPLAMIGVLLALAAALLELGVVGTIGLYTSPQKTVEGFDTIAAHTANWIRSLKPQTFLILLFCFLLCRLSLTLASQYLTISCARRFYAQLGSAGFFRLISDVSLNALNAKSIGHYMTVAGDQIARVSRITSQAGLVVIPLSLAAVYFYAMFLIDRTSMVIFLLFIVIYSGLSLPLFRYMKRLGAESDATSKFINSTFIESLNAVATIRSLDATHVIGSRYSVGLTRYMHIHRNIEFLQASSRLLPGFLLLIIAIIALIIAPSAADDKSIVLLKWLALIFAALRIFPALGQIYSTLQTISSDFNACGAVLSFIGYSAGFRNSLSRLFNEVSQPAEDSKIYFRKNYNLLMKDVSFSHADGKRKILDSITLNFAPGRLYGICGETGVGKSSVAFLLAGLLSPTKGSIRLSSSADAEDSSVELQGRVVMVSQAPFIISDSIRFNIEFGRQTNAEEFMRAVQQAHLQKVLEEKGGPDYVLQYQGSNLSGGQKQRISLARALLKSPAALILDETTAGLDAATKNEILRVLRSICQSTVVIMISHDHDVLRECEIVYQLLDDGKMFPRAVDE